MFIPDSACLCLCACSQGVFIYWLTSTSFSIVSALLLRVSAVRGVLGMGDIAKHPEPAKSESTWSTMKEGEWVVRIQRREGEGRGGRGDGRGGRGDGREGGGEEGGEGRGGRGVEGGYPPRTPKEQSTSGNFNFGFWSFNSNDYDVYQIII